MIELSSDDSSDSNIQILENKIQSTKRKIDQIDSGDEHKSIKKTGSDCVLESNLPNQLNPFNFYFTKVLANFDNEFNHKSLTLTIKDILSPTFGLLKQSLQFNYLFDVDWLIDQYDVNFRALPIVLIGQDKPETKRDLLMQIENYSNISAEFAKINDPWGTHHTKMMLLQYDVGIRVIIHTSNLIADDWNQKTQAMWISDLLPPLKTSLSSVDTSTTQFKNDLIQYLQVYRLPSVNKWIALIKRHDFSSVKVCLIGSVPGRHYQSNIHNFGHMKLRKLLRNHCVSTIDSSWVPIGQFSSIGSLGKTPDNWLTNEFCQSLYSTKPREKQCQTLTPKNNIKLIFPTLENVRNSLEGYRAGASLPYSSNVHQRQTYLKNYFYQWVSDHLNRSKASPHIKTYFRPSADHSKVAWFMLTSANLSKAAWGQLEKKETQLAIRSFELGVLYLPCMFGNHDYFEVLNDHRLPMQMHHNLQIILPVTLPLKPYAKEDEPWMMDKKYNKPDVQGNIWTPS